jgi:hypothetical protein
LCDRFTIARKAEIVLVEIPVEINVSGQLGEVDIG